MQRHQRADRAWVELELAQGRHVRDLPPEELARALAERRVLTFDIGSDGFGGGSVYLSMPGPEDRAPLEGSPAYRQHRVSLVFDALPIDEPLLKLLNGNAWEKLSEVPGFERIWPTKARYTVHGSPGSGAAIVEAALAELGVGFRVADVDARNDEHRGEAFGALNPQRKMPVVETEDGEVWTESLAIVLTLSERHPSGVLFPAGGPERARVLRWATFCATELYPLVEVMDYPKRFVDSGTDALATRATGLWLERWTILEHQIEGEPYFGASGFSAVDLFIAFMSRWAIDADWRASHLPRLDALASAVLARPALKPVIARHIRR